MIFERIGRIADEDAKLLRPIIAIGAVAEPKHIASLTFALRQLCLLCAENDGCARLIIRRIESNIFLEAPPGIEPGMKVLQTSALPLGYGADVERETGLEPATSALARRRSTK